MMDELTWHTPEGFIMQRFCRKCGALMIAYDSLQEDDFTLTWFRCPTSGCHGVTVDVNTCFHLDGLLDGLRGFSGSPKGCSPFQFPDFLN